LGRGEGIRPLSTRALLVLGWLSAAAACPYSPKSMSVLA
jgi:hypothetical protein